VVFTAAQDARETADEVQAEGYLAKPFRFAEPLTVVGEHTSYPAALYYSRMFAVCARPGRNGVALLATIAFVLAACGSAETPRATTAQPAPPGPPPTTAVGPASTRGLARPVLSQSGPVTIFLPRLFEDNSLGLRSAGRPSSLPADPAREALDALIQGPSGDERAADFEYALEPHTELRSVTVTNGTAVVDFGSGVDKVVGRPFSELVYWSIVYTLTEVPGVERVTLAYRGQPMQTLGSPPFPLHPAATRADSPDWARPR
jgi:hypothetical protein